MADMKPEDKDSHKARNNKHRFLRYEHFHRDEIMSITAQNKQDKPVEVTDTPDFKPQGFTLRRKIITGFGGLMLLMALCITITLLELAKIEKSTASVIEQQQPNTILILSLSEELNLAISLLNEYLLTKNIEDLTNYKVAYNQLYAYLGKLEKLRKNNNTIISEKSMEKLKTNLNEISRHGSKLIFLVDNVIENYPGLKIAAEQLNPPALEFIGILNEIIDTNDIDASPENIIIAREHLYQIRYTWTQMMNSIRLYFSQTRNEFKDSSTNLINFNNYSEANLTTFKTLEAMDVDIGFDSIARLMEIRARYLVNMKKVVKTRQDGNWRADITMMRTKVKPLVIQTRSLLFELVDEQVNATKTSDNALTLSLEQIRTYTILLLAFALISGLLLSITISNSILPPIKKLMDAARQIANGDLTTQLAVKTKDEIGLLGGSFNAMIDGLRQAEEEKRQHTLNLQLLNTQLENRVISRTADLKRSETRIRTIFDHVGEGILVLNDGGMINSVNPAASRIFKWPNTELIGTHAVFLLADQSQQGLSKAFRSETELENLFKKPISNHQVETAGQRMNGSTFPMSLLVTNMQIDDEIMHVCIVKDITLHKKAELRLAEAQKDLVNAAHHSGKAEMATGVLHNIGNILNSVSISIEELSRISTNSKIKGLIKANTMLSDNLDNISEFISNDSKGRKLPDYYIKVGKLLDTEINTFIDETRSLTEKTNMMKDVIATQQAYATVSLYTEEFQIAPLLEDTLKMQEASLQKWGVNIITHIDDTPNVKASKSQLLQVITNLIKNAKESTINNDVLNKKREIIVQIKSFNETSVCVIINDNGCGISKNNLSQIFNHGFTTKENGHGFGLHTSANYMTEMRGKLNVSSEGFEKGACFTVIIPTATAINETSSKELLTAANC